MSGIQCDTRRAEDEKERNKHETDSNLVPDDGNGEEIVNNDNETFLYFYFNILKKLFTQDGILLSYRK